MAQNPVGLVGSVLVLLHDAIGYGELVTPPTLKARRHETPQI